MNTKGSVTILFLCLLTLLTLTDCSRCHTNKLEGDSLTFKLTDTQLKDNDRFTIKKDDKIVVPKRNRKQKGPGIVKDKFLELQPVKLSDSGTYNVEVFDVNGNTLKSYSESVCVYAKVPKPRVTITCQNEKVDFRCDVEGGKGLSFSWYKNGEDIKMNVLNFSTNIEENKSNYTCTAQNPVHKSTSDPVEETCFKSATLFGLDFWIMVGILAGGGGLVLVLIIVLVTVACRVCKRREKQHRVVFRLSNLHTSPPPGYQKSKHTTRGRLPPIPQPKENGTN
ncbi:SLAM family member 5-like [Pangasianodon hypophthalmus]|uniref:SLAM family member 5-like n=1 Tax=Pangasianodon hypophthalmus TaxID=310915 RepID=UPI00230767AB|nr:SLAM family member 5-like [Pangasianodon hypophthalmus]